MSPEAKNTGYSQTTREAILGQASYDLRATLTILTASCLPEKALNILPQERKADLLVAGLIFDSSTNSAVVERSASGTKGRVLTCVHLVLASENELYATGVGHGKPDLYLLNPFVLEGESCFSIDWGGKAGQERYYLIDEEESFREIYMFLREEREERDIPEPILELKERRLSIPYGQSSKLERTFLSFNQLVPLRKLQEKLEELASHENPVIQALNDALQAAHGIHPEDE